MIINLLKNTWYFVCFWVGLFFYGSDVPFLHYVYFTGCCILQSKYYGRKLAGTVIIFLQILCSSLPTKFQKETLDDKTRSIIF